MSEREQAKQIIDNLPEYKIGNILLFLKGVQFDDDMEDNGENFPLEYIKFSDFDTKK